MLVGVIMNNPFKVLLLMSAFISASTYVFANDDPKACALISDSLARLTCFDKVFPREQSASTDGQQTPQSESGSLAKWELEQEKSALDDSEKISAWIAPTKATYTGIGQAEVFLLLRCSENTTTAVFTTNMFMVSENARVTVRVGSEPAETSDWERSTNYKAVGRWSGAQAIPFIKKLKNGQKLAVRVQEKDRIDAEFDLGNVEEVAARLASACKWK